MDIIRYAINKPVSVAVGVIFVLLFGIIGLKSLPLQLTPDVEEPQITVRTLWPGASPTEVEQDIIELQEDRLKGLQSLKKMESSSYSDYGEVSLTFETGTDIDTALLRVSNKLDEVSGYPDNVEKPSVEASGAQSQPVIWIMFKTLETNTTPIDTYRTYFEDALKQKIERVKGVGSLFIGGGTAKQLKIEVDPEKLSRYNLTLGQVAAKIRGANTTVSAGKIGISKKNYRIKTISRFQTPEDALDTVLFDNGVTRVKLGDVGKAYIGYDNPDFSVRQNSSDVIAIGVRKEQGANVVALTNRLKAIVDEMNVTILKDEGLELDWVYDDAPYILNAIDIVRNNVFVGALLAIVILFTFLRSLSATLTTAAAIPISATGTFIFLWIMGRNLNVVSLAGIAFAVGMLVDNAIVSLENIDRHRMMGKKPFDAAYEGAKEVWGAIFASTATTVAVFVPIIFMEEEAGQLFKDIAIAITFSIILSLTVSVTVIPSLLNKLYAWRDKRGTSRIGGKTIVRNDPLARAGKGASALIVRLSSLSLKNTWTRIASVVLMTCVSILVVWLLFPKAEYLPKGNRNLVISLIIPPPGISVEKRKELGRFIESQTAPYFKNDWKDGIPQISDIWYVGTENLTLFGGVSAHPTEAGKMVPLFMRIVNSVPDMFGVSFQAGIFQSDLGGGRTIDVNIQGSDLNRLTGMGKAFYGSIMGAVPGSQIRPIPSLETSYPEVHIRPDKEKLAASGFVESEFGQYVDIIMDGRKIDEFRPAGKNQLDMILTAPESAWKTPEAIMNTQIVNNYGDLVRVADLASLTYTTGMTQINHLERKRNITLQVTPPDAIPFQEAVDNIDAVVEDFQKKGMLDDLSVEIGGNASKLKTTISSLAWNFLLAVAIIYLLMSALFENFFYPLIILFTVPLAAAGGFVGLWLVNHLIAPQPLDILAMLGFIILVGTVVNNAILVVHQSLNNMRFDGYQPMEAIRESVKTRIRPIFMSTMTTLFGMFPLVLSTGAGSELYRGLGSILLGGLAVSAMFTLFVIPALLAFFIKMEETEDAEAA